MPNVDKHAAATQAVNILEEIAAMLNCQLDRRIISISVSLIEQGIHPEALSQVIKELRQERQAMQQQQAASQ